MTNTLKVDFTKRKIIMDRTFAKLAEDTNSIEYRRLQEVRRDYPDFKVEQKHIRTNPNKKTYCGLSYNYMEGYILAHGTREIAKEFYHMREIAECQGKAFRYPVIKSWFLDRFPEIVQFGIVEDASAVDVAVKPQTNELKVVENGTEKTSDDQVAKIGA